MLSKPRRRELTKECGRESGAIGGCRGAGAGTRARSGASLPFRLAPLRLRCETSRLRVQLALAIRHKVPQEATLAPPIQKERNSGSGRVGVSGRRFVRECYKLKKQLKTYSFTPHNTDLQNELHSYM